MKNNPTHAERALPIAIGDLLETHGRFGVSIVLTSLLAGALATGISSDELMEDLAPLIEKYASDKES